MNHEKKRGLGTLDVFIIVAILICGVCLAFRMWGGSETVNTIDETKTYTLEISVKNIRETSLQYFDKGEPFFYEKEKSRLLLGDVISLQSSAAKVLYEDSDGKYLLVPNTAVTGQSKRVDVTLTLEVEGRKNAAGEFLLGGSDYLAVNKEIKLANKYVEVNGVILSLTEAMPMK